mmetsp:Transcript_108371/g.349832  ORF Transcript_108371/g.349832 Transcript_108371/m.349832 type:complete len:287 (+) Transcript_108371:989-1849(+)
MESAVKPSWYRELARSSAICFWLTKTRTLWSSEASRASVTWRSRKRRFCEACFSQSPGLSSTTTTRCSMPSRACSLEALAPPSAPASSLPWPLEMRTGPGPSGSQSPRASSWTAGPQVAEKKSTCRSGRMRLEMDVTSPRKPRSSMRSASSSTKYVTRCRRRSPVLWRSRRRPGVAATIWQPFLRAATCGALFSTPPPKRQTAPMPWGPWLPLDEPWISFCASSAICTASSRTGASTRAMGEAACLCSGFCASMCTTAGSRYAKVLPLPVLAMPMMSWPASTSGMA